MRITVATVTNYKRIRDITIEPPADRSILLIGGKNRQGKTSLLDALSVAFGGKKLQAADPVRHGEEEARIHVELDNGLVIDRRIKLDGTTVLEVRDRNGKVSSPQAMLDKLVGARFLDPIAFLNLKPPEQRAQLLTIIDREGVLSKLEERRERIFSNRTDVGRQIKAAQGELDRLPIVKAPGEPIDVGALAAERAAFSDEQRASEALIKDLSTMKRDLANEEAAIRVTNTEIAELERKLALAREKLQKHEQRVEELRPEVDKAELLAQHAVDHWKEKTARREQVDADLARANEHNRKVVEAEQMAKRRSDADAVVKRLEMQRDSQTETLAKIDAQKLQFLKESALPVDGLGVESDHLTYRGVPLAQASGAEKHRVSLALAIASSPSLDDIWIRDGALLDEDSLEQVAADAEAAGKRLWIERVGDHDDGAIIISDGLAIE